MAKPTLPDVLDGLSTAEILSLAVAALLHAGRQEEYAGHMPLARKIEQTTAPIFELIQWTPEGWVLR